MKLALLFSILFFGTYTENVDDQLLPTKLRITVINGLGNFVEGASVSIYENEADYRASENAVATGETDKKGRIVFKDVKPMAYYVEAKKGEKNNNGEGVLTSVLSEGKINRVNTVIE